MNLFSFLRPSIEKQIQRARKKVKEPHGDPAVRVGAARKLREIGTEEAILALLDRFTISSSPSSQDEEEKREVLSWIVELGEKAVPPLVQFLKRERQVYWPMRALQEILEPDRLAATVVEILRHHWENPPAVTEPIAQLIRFVEGLHSEELEEVIRLFLRSPDDDVCVAALDYLFSRPEEEAREAVLECYLECEDRPRVRHHILQQLAEVGWSVRGYRPKIEETLPEGYLLTREGRVMLVGRRP